MILERTGDGCWRDSESDKPVHGLGSWGWLCELVGVDPDEDDEFPLPGA